MSAFTLTLYWLFSYHSFLFINIIYISILIVLVGNKLLISECSNLFCQYIIDIFSGTDSGRVVVMALMIVGVTVGEYWFWFNCSFVIDIGIINIVVIMVVIFINTVIVTICTIISMDGLLFSNSFIIIILWWILNEWYCCVCV